MEIFWELAFNVSNGDQDCVSEIGVRCPRRGHGRICMVARLNLFTVYVGLQVVVLLLTSPGVRVPGMVLGDVIARWMKQVGCGEWD